MIKKERLYLVINKTMFISDTSDLDTLKKEAEFFHKEEVDCNGYTSITVTEVTSIDQVPPEWRNGPLLWGDDKETTIEGFFKDSIDFKEYLRLKAKFE